MIAKREDRVMFTRTVYGCGISVITAQHAVAEQFAEAVAAEADTLDAGFALIFFSRARVDADALVDALADHAPALPYAGCSTAGEITPAGLDEGGMLAMLLPRASFNVVSSMIGGVSATGMETIALEVAALRHRLAIRDGDSGRARFAICLIDGMSYAEEAVTSALHWSLDDIPLIGGSAGDDLKFEVTNLIHDGRAASNAAIVMLLSTDVPFQVFKSENFRPTEEKLVVTASDPDRRIVHEFNAAPAAEEFATAVGVPAHALTPMSFASHPVVLKVGGEYYCRSIQKLNGDGSLSFFCAIDDGIVLSIAEPTSMVESTRAALGEAAEKVGGLDMVLGFDCVLRRLDARNRQLFREMSELYRQNNVIGFGTYGEQYRSMHLNQTFTGIAFGRREAAQ